MSECDDKSESSQSGDERVPTSELDGQRADQPEQRQARVLFSESNDQCDDQSGRVTASQSDGLSDDQSGEQHDSQPVWKQRLQRLCGSGSFWLLLAPSGSMCFAPSGWRGMQTVGRGATMRPGCAVLTVQLNLLNLLSLLNLLNLLNTRLGVDMYSM